jgi:hypothetical protein
MHYAPVNEAKEEVKLDVAPDSRQSLGKDFSSNFVRGEELSCPWLLSSGEEIGEVEREAHNSGNVHAPGAVNLQVSHGNNFPSTRATVFG